MNAEPIETPLPANWRRFQTEKLEELFETLDDSTFAYDDVATELAARMIEDNRVAQGQGFARGELPS